MLNQNLCLPDFQNSIVNLGATMAEFLGQKPQHATLPTVTKRLDPKVKNVIYLVIDGMGAKILEKNLPSKSFLRQHMIQTVTSVFPSTTTAATTALITGQTSSQHGWFAWAVDFDGTVVELFRNKNYYTQEILSDSNFVKNRLPYRTIWENAQITRKTSTCFPEHCYKHPAKQQSEYVKVRQMFRQLHKTCKEPDQKFIYAYVPDFDSTMHKTGTTSRKSHRLLKYLERKIVHLTKKNPDTTFVITADHGQIDVQGYDLIYQDQTLQNCLARPISWEGRAACFYLKPAHDNQFREAFQKYQKDYLLLSKKELVEQGLLGNFTQRPDLLQHIGDYVAIGNQNNRMMILKEPEKGKKLYRGAHGGLTADEMTIPVIIVNGKSAGE